jgi:hypothetical protein
MCDELESVDAATGIEETYAFIDESFREDWEAPGMGDYDRYLLGSEAMRQRLLDARNRTEGISLEAVRAQVGI